MIFGKMPTDYNNCGYFSLSNSAKYVHLWGDVKNGQAQFICKKVMLLARKLDVQYQQYNKTIHELLLEEIPLLLPRIEKLKRCKRGTIGILFKAIIGIASGAVSAFIRQW